MASRQKLIILLIIAFATGLLGGYFFHDSFKTDDRGIIIREGKYKLINPILACEIAQKGSFTELNSVKSSLQHLISRKIGNGEASEISIYLRLLNSGRWFGIGENESYTPASLMKVLIMMTFFKEAEDYPGVLKKVVEFNDISEPPEFGPDGRRVPPLEMGDYYSIEELIRRMIVDSSNASEHLLLEYINISLLEETVSDLGLPTLLSDRSESSYLMSPIRYALALRVLYGASYLNREMSERGLSLLTNSKYEDGIKKKTPKEVLVANKFGIFTKNEASPRELHDC